MQEIPNAKDIVEHASGIDDRRARLRFIEIQMDKAAALNSALWDLYSLHSRQIIGPLQQAAEGVCEYDWSDNDDDAVEAISALRQATK